MGTLVLSSLILGYKIQLGITEGFWSKEDIIALYKCSDNTVKAGQVYGTSNELRDDTSKLCNKQWLPVRQNQTIKIKKKKKSRFHPQ